MTQLIFGAALGFLLGEGVLHGIKHSIGWLQRDEVRQRVGKLSSVRGLSSSAVSSSMQV
jgi:hypothetical protein